MNRFDSVPFSNIDINSGFWQYRQRLNREVTVGAVMNRFMDTGRFDAFELKWREGMDKKPHIFWDSDIAKWMESVAYLLKKGPAPELKAVVERVIDLIEAGQGRDGYFNTYFINVEPSKRFQQRWAHELYCAGHLIEAAVAYDEATGDDRFLNIMTRYADYIDQVFRVEQSAAFATPGHEEIELALVKLYRHTGKERYLTLSKWFIDQRGLNEREAQNAPLWELLADQSHLPVREMETAEGHSVRLGYLFSGAADVALETGDEALFSACRKVFENIISKRMYVTGGVGSTPEAFTVDFDLPNDFAYAETCAAIALAYFARRMLAMDADAVYADVIETILYNGFLASTSLDGKRFFYCNPLSVSRRSFRRNVSSKNGRAEWRPDIQRVEVFGCSCCPPNITRFVASVGDYLYTTGENRLYVHQFMGSDAKITLAGRDILVRQETDYPVNGAVKLTVQNADGLEVAIRIPGWCAGYDLSAPHTLEKGYAIVRCAGDSFELTLTTNMKCELIEANPEVQADAGRVALRRGPVIYCLEEADNGERLHDMMIDMDLKTREAYSEEMRMPIIYARGWQRAAAEMGWLYRPLNPQLQEKELTFIPYYAFANRGESDMIVWVPLKR